MKRVVFALFFVCALLITVVCAVGEKDSEIPVKPKNVPLHAVWKKHSSLWSTGTFENGDINLWYPSGSLMYAEKIIKINFKKTMRYHENGKLEEIGYFYFFKDKYFNNDGNSHDWLEIGKWKEFDEEGNLINEWCYSPPPYEYFETVEKCGVEIFYNKDGSIKKKIIHEYKCEYGCDEPE
jgi:antitoxin component YwqK of YwqJK toxin-antitoxin module